MTKSKRCTAWAIAGARLCSGAFLQITLVRLPPFFTSLRAKLVAVALLLLLVPLVGFRFVQEMERYLREGHREVLVSAAKLLSATLSDRPQLFVPPVSGPDAQRENDDAERTSLLAMFGATEPSIAAGLGGAYVPSEEVQRILAVVAGNASRTWVVDSESRVRGLAGRLDGAGSSDLYSPLARFNLAVSRTLAAWLPSARDESIALTPQQSQALVMDQVERALRGEPTQRVRTGNDRTGPIVSVAQPIWIGERIVGAVVLEETSSSVQALRRSALESVLVVSGAILMMVLIVLAGFAWRITARVRRLQREADAAIDAHGRIRGGIAPEIGGLDRRDEIGALANTLSTTLERLKRYNAHLEQLAGRLSHELRTPLAVVRSSLDNLKQTGVVPGENPYLVRADEGIQRLANLIARLSESTQLERMLESAERELIDLTQLVGGCVRGYEQAYAPRKFELSVPEQKAPMHAVPDALVQMLDKLVQNANDFAPEGKPIRIALAAHSSWYEIRVENDGAPIPADLLPRLGGSLVSGRADAGSKGGHLGLGLFVARIIAEFHGGSIRAENLADGTGVAFTAILAR